MLRPKRARLLTTFVAAGVLTAGMALPAAAADYQSEKAAVADAADALADTDSWAVNRLLARSADVITDGLSAENWDDGMPASLTTFRADLYATTLMWIAARWANRRGDAATADAVIQLRLDLAEIDGAIAAEHVAAAAIADPDHRRLGRAERLLASGDEALVAGRVGRAIRRYSRAYRVAIRILAEAPPVVEPTGNPSIAIEVNWRFVGDSTWLPADEELGAFWVWIDDDVELQWLVANTGDVELTDVSATDNLYVGLVCPVGGPSTLAPGGSFECVQDANLTLDHYTHTGTATGTWTNSGGAGVVTDTNELHLNVDDAQGG